MPDSLKRRKLFLCRAKTTRWDMPSREMKIDLAAMARRQGTAPARPVVLTRIEVTGALQSDLAVIYARAVSEWGRRARGPILAAYGKTLSEIRAGIADAQAMNDTLDDIRVEVDRATDELSAILLTLGLAQQRWSARFEGWHRLKWIRLIMSGSRVDLSLMLGPGDVRDTVQAFVERNAALLRSVAEQARAGIADAVLRGVQQRSPVRQLSETIAKVIASARARALGIGAGQAKALGEDLTTARMLQVGQYQFRWRHSGKKDYRPEHKARGGRIYSLKRPPSPMPGVAPNCGCTKEPVLILRAARGRFAGLESAP